MAISRERLEELIEQKAIIWAVYDYSYSYDKPNKKVEYIDLDDFYHYYKDIDEFIMYQGDYSDLFETEEEAKWHKEFGCITRTEKLELPTWEELFKQDRVLDCYTQEFGIVKNRSFIKVVLLGVDFANEIVEVCIGSNQLFVEKLTKENYIKACRKAKELFLGE